MYEVIRLFIIMLTLVIGKCIVIILVSVVKIKYIFVSDLF